MGIRETLNRNPGLTTGVTLGIIVLALIVIGYQTMSGGSGKIPTQAYYTIDDGQTWFADDIKLIAPFEKDGKQAYRIFVYRCGSSGKPFAGHMERYTPDAKAKMEAARNQTATEGAPPMPPMMLDLEMSGREVKKPGDPNWVSMANMRGVESIISPKCEDGEMLEVVMP